MRNSIAKKTVLPIFLIFLVLMLIVSTAAYRYVTDQVIAQSKDALTQTARYFQYEIWGEAPEESDETEEEFLRRFESVAQSTCDFFRLDFASLYIPHEETGEISFLSVVYSSDIAESGQKIKQAPYSREYRLSPEEQAVWDGEIDVGYLVYAERYGTELCAEIRGTLPSGQMAMATLERSFSQLDQQIKQNLVVVFGMVFVVYILICAVLHFIIWHNVTRPAKRVSETMNLFVADGSRTENRLDERRGDEFGIINKAFNHMADNIASYVRNINALTEEQHRQKTEMNIASRIQMGFLPPEEASFDGCEIRAKVLPARDVGGDLYDYLKIDADRVLVSIADVSGKGLSAAGFMGVTLALLHQFASMGLQPAEILRKTNEYLVNKNPSMLFVTAFVGIYDNRTRVFTYSNAGHNLPYVRSSRIAALDGARGTVLGLFEDETYEQTTLSLRPGETLFLYTDGLNEAVNGENGFYGMPRLEAALADYRPSLTQSLVGHMEQSVRAFSEGAAQSDDLTMLSLTAKEQTELTLRADRGEFIKIKSAILDSIAPDSLKLPLCLAAEEIFVNIVSYAFGENPPDEPCVKFLFAVSDHVRLRFEDGGVPYNPLQEVITADEYDLDDGEGGLGKLIAFSIADDVRYSYENQKNTLTMVKYMEDAYEN